MVGVGFIVVAIWRWYAVVARQDIGVIINYAMTIILINDTSMFTAIHHKEKSGWLMINVTAPYHHYATGQSYTGQHVCWLRLRRYVAERGDYVTSWLEPRGE